MFLNCRKSGKIHFLICFTQQKHLFYHLISVRITLYRIFEATIQKEKKNRIGFTIFSKVFRAKIILFALFRDRQRSFMELITFFTVTMFFYFCSTNFLVICRFSFIFSFFFFGENNVSSRFIHFHFDSTRFGCIKRKSGIKIK